jgi:anti-anti-sigma factor
MAEAMDRTGQDATPRTVPPGELGVSDRVDGDRHVIALTGELDIASVRTLQAKVVELCTDEVRSLVIDLSELTFIDSTGMRAIMGARRLCEERSCDFSLVPGGENIQRVFVLAGLDEYLPFVDDALQVRITDGDGRTASPGALPLSQGPSQQESR